MKLKVLAIVLLLVVGGAAIVVATGGLPSNAAAASTYLTSQATVADVTDDVAATGAVAATTSWSLAFGVAPTTSTASDSSASDAAPTGTWTATEVKVKVGDTVTKGQLLATATNATLASDVTAARNDVTSANLQYLLAKESYDTAVDNGNSDAIRQSRIGLLNATNGLATARAKLVDLQRTTARAKLLAPAAGMVTAVNVASGTDAPSGAAITIDESTYQVTADVVESDVSSIRLDEAASVSVSAIGAALSGTVVSIAPTASSSSSGSGSGVVSYAVTIALKTPPLTLRSGMTADITITTASATGVLAVPAAAIRGTTGNYSVLVLVSGKPEARAVTVGLMTSSLVEIKSGLTDGESVVIGTNSQQRSGTNANSFGPGGGGFVVPGGGGRVDVKGG